MSVAQKRIAIERKQWRKDHPIGFWARPKQGANDEINMMIWECGIPGKEDTIWAGGEYGLLIEFSDQYPERAPLCRFSPPIPHPNVFPDGEVCLSIINEEENYKPSLSVKQILVGIQELLNNPNPDSPANEQAYTLYVRDRPRYIRTVKEYAQNHPPKVQ